MIEPTTGGYGEIFLRIVENARAMEGDLLEKSYQKELTRLAIEQDKLNKLREKAVVTALFEKAKKMKFHTYEADKDGKMKIVEKPLFSEEELPMVERMLTLMPMETAISYLSDVVKQKAGASKEIRDFLLDLAKLQLEQAGLKLRTEEIDKELIGKIISGSGTSNMLPWFAILNMLPTDNKKGTGAFSVGMGIGMNELLGKEMTNLYLMSNVRNILLMDLIKKYFKEPQQSQKK